MLSWRASVVKCVVLPRLPVCGCGGDIRRICDLFRLSIAGANRYASTLNHPGLDSR
jgi:hypothetical protein